MCGLLESNIFSTTIDFDEWPANHGIDDEASSAYNGSFFALRYNYNAIFPDYPAGEETEIDPDDPAARRAKGFKIRYKINLLPTVDEYVIEDSGGYRTIVNEGKSFIDACCDSEEIDVFDVENLQEYLDFKWDRFARQK